MAVNYKRHNFAGSLWKSDPKVVAKIEKRNVVKRMDRIEKESVRVRDKESCRVCGKKTRDVHERLMKSLGGVASTANSLCLDRKCHTYAHAHGFKVIGATCDGPLIFQMCKSVAHDIFRGRAVPKHVEIVG